MARSGAREAMIDAAERIVAERGLAALTLRDVQAAAGQANKSAARYHFGSRDGLVAAIIDARMGPVDRRRWELLARLDEAGERASSRRLVEALVYPLAAETLGRDASRYGRFLAQAMFDPTLAAHIQEHLRAESFRSVRRRLEELGHLTPDVAQRRAVNIVTLAIVTIATWEGRTRDLSLTTAVIADLVETCVAVLDAPSAATAQPPGEANGTRAPHPDGSAGDLRSARRRADP